MTTPAYSVNLANLDLTVLVDRSGSMGNPEKRGSSVSRWKAAEETTKGFVRDLGAFDDDGIDLAFFNARFETAEGVTPDSFGGVWDKQSPGGGTVGAPPLKWALDKAAKRWNEKNQLIVVITDGEAGDPEDVVRTIIAATKQMERDSQVAILFVQVGDDPNATAYLQRLDDSLQAEGAAFDIVDVTTLEEIANKSLQDVVNKAFND